MQVCGVCVEVFGVYVYNVSVYVEVLLGVCWIFCVNMQIFWCVPVFNACVKVFNAFHPTRPPIGMQECSNVISFMR